MTTLQEEFLRTFHAAHPAVTVRAMAHGKTADGRSSYELLRDRVSECDRVLDLGCGDGLLLELLAARPAGAPSMLAGLDLSAEELALARPRPGLAAADLRPGRAQQLPFADGWFDGCLSHMALMLMSEVEQVAAEVARVLAPGGVLAVVLGAGAAGGEACESFLRLARPLFEAAPAAQRIPPLGGPRLRTREGFDAVFRPAGFAPAEWETVRIDLTGPPEQVWRTVGAYYDLGPLDPAVTADLRARFEAESAAMALPDGRVPCGMKVHVAMAVRGRGA
ncbi:methyltransferase domain-containing protein [Streptomyces platensis]|uniref:Methyltransferase domain-containing protein n=1 Tax=Streptomyces platensis TaxID=58346 RepID=A0AAE6NLK8_STRPT|nr:class I SAM-dependent methyltransferase [Streptomyces platensis]OSY37349.1 Phthiotriol/phenolphthiotriol dimycocerosates methyltransferase [Streptomyces platensis]QEV54065.1 methyltransferase domain-containing protein [Streptomyces platensis]